MDTLTEVEDLLDGWAGSLVVVSHDRYFLERVTDHVVALLGHGKLSYLGGGVEEYLARRAAQVEAGPDRETQSSRPGTAGVQRAASKEMQRLERQIERLTTRETELSAELAAHASDFEQLIELGQELRAVQDERARLEERWLTVAEEL